MQLCEYRCRNVGLGYIDLCLRGREIFNKLTKSTEKNVFVFEIDCRTRMYDTLTYNINRYVWADCERPIQPIHRSRPTVFCQVPLIRFSGPLRSIFRSCSHALVLATHLGLILPVRQKVNVTWSECAKTYFRRSSGRREFALYRLSIVLLLTHVYPTATALGIISVNGPSAFQHKFKRSTNLIMVIHSSTQLPFSPNRTVIVCSVAIATIILAFVLLCCILLHRHV